LAPNALMLILRNEGKHKLKIVAIVWKLRPKEGKKKNEKVDKWQFRDREKRR